MIIPLDTPEKFYRSIIDIVKTAEAGDELYLNYFVVREDYYGHKLLRNLVVAAQRQVKIVLIVDAYGSLFPGDVGSEYDSYPLSRTLLFYLREFNIKTYIFHQLVSTSVTHYSNLLNWDNYARRNHNKNFIFHLKRLGKRGLIVGDAQWTDAHFDDRFQGNNVYVEDPKIFQNALDYTLSLIDSSHLSIPVAKDVDKKMLVFYQRIYQNITAKRKTLSDWTWFRPEMMIIPESVEFVFSDIDFTDPYKRHTIENFEIALLQNARNDVWYATPYFCPGNELQQAFIAVQKQSHLDFKILMAKFRHDPYLPYGTRLAASRLIRNGIKIYEYLGVGNLHYKDLLVDDYSFIKTANGDGRSRFYNLETGVIIKSAAYAKQNKQKMLANISDAKLLHRNSTYLQEALLPQRLVKMALAPFFYKHL